MPQVCFRRSGPPLSPTSCAATPGPPCCRVASHPQVSGLAASPLAPPSRKSGSRTTAAGSSTTSAAPSTPFPRSSGKSTAAPKPSSTAAFCAARTSSRQGSWGPTLSASAGSSASRWPPPAVKALSGCSASSNTRSLPASAILGRHQLGRTRRVLPPPRVARRSPGRSQRDPVPRPRLPVPLKPVHCGWWGSRPCLAPGWRSEGGNPSVVARPVGRTRRALSRRCHRRTGGSGNAVCSCRPSNCARLFAGAWPHGLCGQPGPARPVYESLSGPSARTFSSRAGSSFPRSRDAVSTSTAQSCSGSASASMN